MIRHILLVESSAVMRRILHGKIMANLNDTCVAEAQDEGEALDYLSGNSCHLVLFSCDGQERGLSRFQAALRERGGNTPPLLLLTSHPENVPKECSASEKLSLPCSAWVLTETINRACNPVSLRRSKRYSFAGAKVRIQQKTFCFEGDLINISHGGLLCELDWSDDFRWGLPLVVETEIPSGGAAQVTGGFYAKCVNLSLIASNPDFSPRKVRAALAFVHVPPPARDQLEAVFAGAEQDEGEREG